jgi:hypothetical protein
MTAKIERYCLCGASLRGRVAPAASASGLVAMFVEHHTGSGHGEATVSQAAQARRNEERVIGADRG